VAGGRLAVVGDGLGGAAPVSAACGLERQAARSSVDRQLDDNVVDVRPTRCAELDGRAFNGPDGHPLVRLEAVGMAEAERAVSDHGHAAGDAPAPDESSTSGAAALGAPPTTPSSIARVRYMAWDQRSGVATGPQRATHAERCSGARRQPSTCSGSSPSGVACRAIHASSAQASPVRPTAAWCQPRKPARSGHSPPPY
jgi:hypothetical protein